MPRHIVNHVLFWLVVFLSFPASLLAQTAARHNNRGLVWLDKGEYDKAIADCNEALRLDPNFACAYGRRGNALRRKGEYDKALADYTRALQLDKQDAHAYRRLAWLHATCPDEFQTLSRILRLPKSSRVRKSLAGVFL